MEHVSLGRFELLELRRDDGIQTYHAREIATKRPVQVHVFANGPSPDNLALLTKVAYLPDAERNRVIDRGMIQGRPYVVTDRLAGFASLREWLDQKSVAMQTLDQQFAQLFDRPMSVEITPKLEEPSGIASRPLRSRILALVLGTAAAILFLVLLLASIAFRPR
jgi:hypothetical protein